jgi:hypothetical protein
MRRGPARLDLGTLVVFLEATRGGNSSPRSRSPRSEPGKESAVTVAAGAHGLENPRAADAGDLRTEPALMIRGSCRRSR